MEEILSKETVIEKISDTEFVPVTTTEKRVVDEVRGEVITIEKLKKLRAERITEQEEESERWASELAGAEATAKKAHENRVASYAKDIENYEAQIAEAMEKGVIEKEDPTP